MKSIFIGFVLILASAINPVQELVDQKTVIQMCIDLEELQQFYHADKIPGRKPLIIFNNEVVPSNLELIKFGEPVVFMKKEDLFFHQKEAFLNFGKFDISRKKAEVHFEYQVEGVFIEVAFEKKDTRWVIRNKKLTEK